MPPNPFAPVRIGNVYQRFGSLESGLCQNIIKASVPFLLEEGMCTYAADQLSHVPCKAQQRCHSPADVLVLQEAPPHTCLCRQYCSVLWLPDHQNMTLNLTMLPVH